jgi:branched-chain amino acid transport system ATP-binding protein
VSGLCVGYGKAESVLHNVSLNVDQGEFVSIFGPNGAGKSTLMNTIAGCLPVRSGHIRFAGEDITRLSPRQRVDRGLVLALEGHRVVGDLSVEDNLRLALFRLTGGIGRREVTKRLNDIYARIDLLAKFRHKVAGMMSGGEQQMIVIGRLLIAQPRMLLLDEPSLGLAPVFVEKVYAELAEVIDASKSVLLVEQSVEAALSISHRSYVLSLGDVVSGPDDGAWSREAIVRRYFGHDELPEELE